MIPDYQSMMLPFLNLIGDGAIHTTSEILPKLALQFHLNEEEINELTPTKKHKVFTNRVHWVKAQLKTYGLIEILHRHTFQISERGKLVLQEGRAAINNQYLKERFKALRGDTLSSDINDPKEDGQTPEELMESGHLKLRQVLEVEVLSKLKAVHPSFFERIVIKLLVRMGYGGSIEEAGKVTRYTNDQGIDGTINEDKLGLDVIYIQAKRWEGTVGRPEIQKFVGALAGQRSKKGVFITTSNFSKEAILYAAQMDAKIILMDGEKLAQYMIDYNVGVSVKETYEIKIMDSDYFEED